jgi:hypothetical protein
VHIKLLLNLFLVNEIEKTPRFFELIIFCDKNLYLTLPLIADPESICNVILYKDALKEMVFTPKSL